MKIQQPYFPAPEVVGGGAVFAYRVLEGAETYNLLTDSLYTFKAGASVRELCCNAQDAHTASGTPSRPIEVSLPTPENPIFMVRDYGQGMSLATLTELYSVVGWSNKRNDNSLIGGQGIGSKAPLAFLKMSAGPGSSPAFTVQSVHAGQTTTVATFIDSTGVPKMQVLHEGKTDEASGTTVQFAVSPEYMAAFNEEAARVLALFNPCPIYSGVDIPPAKATRVSLVDTKFFFMSPAEAKRALLQPVPFSVRQNNVVYPCDMLAMTGPLYEQSAEAMHFWEELAYGTKNDNGARKYAVVLDLPEGAMSFVPSREGLQRTEQNCKALSAALLAQYEILKEATQKLVQEHGEESARTMKAWVKALGALPTDAASSLLLGAARARQNPGAARLAAMVAQSSPAYIRGQWGKRFNNVAPYSAAHKPSIHSTSRTEVKRMNLETGLSRKVESDGVIGKKPKRLYFTLPISVACDMRMVYVDTTNLKKAAVSALLNAAKSAFAKANPHVTELCWLVYETKADSDSQAALCSEETARQQKAAHPLLSDTPVMALSELLKSLGVPFKPEARVSRAAASLTVYDVAKGTALAISADKVPPEADSWLVLKDILVTDGKLRTGDPRMVRLYRHQPEADVLNDYCKGMTKPPAFIVLATKKLDLPRSLTAKPDFLETFKAQAGARWARLSQQERGIVHCLRTGSRFGNIMAIRTASGAFEGLDYAALYRKLERDESPLLEAVTVLMGRPSAERDEEFTTWARSAIAGMAHLGLRLTYGGRVVDELDERHRLREEEARISEQFPLLSLQLDVAKELSHTRFDPATKLRMAETYLSLLKSFNAAPANQLKTFFELHDY